jgi:hypothetical protein
VGNLALFHRDFRWSAGLVRLGRVISGHDHLRDVEGPATISVAGA